MSLRKSLWPYNNIQENYKMSQNGKGDKRRPKSVDYQVWEKNYNRIFRKKEHEKVNKKSKK